MPATYAAVTASLNALGESGRILPGKPARCRRRPGTATWAAAEAFSSLERFTLLDANSALRTLALDLGQRSTACATWLRRGEARAALADSRAGRPRRRKLHDRRNRRGRANGARRTDVGQNPRHAAGRRARHARRLCADHRAARAADRIGRACRRALPARRQCPLVAPDWCHFTQRLPRSRAHKQIKGAECPSRTKNLPMSR